MKKQSILSKGILAACAMLVIILDTKTAIISAREGVELCICTIIPSLFPFFVLSSIINSCLLGQHFRLFQPLGRLCKIPKGTESLLILGLIAGYPIGAQLIAQSYQEGKLTKSAARRMLGFCNNAGPAFFFGIASPLFTSAKTIWILWGVHILSALVTGYVLPSEITKPVQISSSAGISFPAALQKALRTTGTICGWVLLFRVVLGFCNRWFFWLFPVSLQILLSGFLELSNGCVLLHNISSEGMRFLLAGTMLSFGGMCVGMQTFSVTEGLGTGWYFPGKVFQTTFTVLLCLLLQPVLFSGAEPVTPPLSAFIGLAFFLLALVFLFRRKKVVAFQDRLLYNTGN